MNPTRHYQEVNINASMSRLLPQRVANLGEDCGKK
jgi:hypothetical protein